MVKVLMKSALEARYRLVYSVDSPALRALVYEPRGQAV